MSWIRLVRDENPAGSYDGTPQYDGVCEESADLTAEQNSGYAEYGGGRKVLGVGSMVYCLETESCSIKTSDGSWAGIGGGGSAAEGAENGETVASNARRYGDGEADSSTSLRSAQNDGTGETVASNARRYEDGEAVT